MKTNHQQFRLLEIFMLVFLKFDCYILAYIATIMELVDDLNYLSFDKGSPCLLHFQVHITLYHCMQHWIIR